MYLHHFGLSEKPFQISPDPRFLWMGEKHKEAFANLMYSMIDQNGFLVLTGDVGSGKTTLLNAMLQNIDSDVRAATISNPRMELVEMLRFIARSFDDDARCENKTEFIMHMNRIFREAETQKKKLLLVIDEAHLLSTEQLEEIRLISNIESAHKKLITIILIGQNELDQKLRSDTSRALRQRVTLYYQLQPFSGAETARYIKHRLRIAGTAEDIFTSGAISEIQHLTGGLPRLINIVCARALLTGYAQGVKTVGRIIVRECGTELHLPEHKQVTAKPAPVTEPTRPKNRQTALAAAALVILGIPALTVLGVKVLSDNPIRYVSERSRPVSGPAAGAPAALPGLADTGRMTESPDEAQRLLSQARPEPPAPYFSSAPEPATALPEKQEKLSVRLSKASDPAVQERRSTEPDSTSPAGAVKEQAPSTSEASAVLESAELPRPPEPSPDTGTVVRELAQNALENQNYRYAIEMVEHYLEAQTDPSPEIRQVYVQALIGQGHLHLEANRYKEAEANLVRAVAEAPGDFDAHFELGKLYTRTREYPKAVDSYKRAITIKPDSAAGLYNLGFVYAGQQDYTNAEKVLRKAIGQEAPFADKIYFNLGVVQLKLGKKNDGIANIRKSLGINPENSRARQFLVRLEGENKKDG